MPFLLSLLKNNKAIRGSSAIVACVRNGLYLDNDEQDSMEAVRARLRPLSTYLFGPHYKSAEYDNGSQLWPAVKSWWLSTSFAFSR
ncbi:hypothetical protein TNCT_315141 [Trichonephila clavata]|uniref:Uncharacterized protein n=1 Tax=Trichonephila clavata TaxID=2740835 RepID=A0A8X6LFL7_TRICU|nr:hypothetical protein TNCT_315141 [Trichonephila clavata]